MRILELEKSINTQNFLLEPITVRHAEKLFEKLQSEKLYTFIPQNPPVSLQSLKDKYSRWSMRISADQNEIWLNYAILRLEDQHYVGTLQATIQLKGETYIAYEVFPAYWQNGIAKESCKALIDFLVSKFKVRKISAHIDTRNIASIKLIENLNFNKVGLIENADSFKGSISHEFVYELEISKV